MILPFDRGHISAVGQAWDAAYRGWLPRSEYADAETPAFERYDDRFDASTGTGVFEIWLPVAPRK